MKVSIVMPVYNEVATVEKILDKLKKLDVKREIIIVDDGSTDGTVEFLKGITGKENSIKVFFRKKNSGKGAALRTGFQHCTGDIIAIQDADLEYEPKELLHLIQPIVDQVADVVYGSRLSGGKPQRVYLFWHLVGNKFLSLLANILYNTTITDMETCYKVFSKKVLDRLTLKSNGFEIEAELTAKIFKQKFRVYEMPISYFGRTYDEGKKISWRDGLTAVWTLFKYRFVD